MGGYVRYSDSPPREVSSITQPSFSLPAHTHSTALPSPVYPSVPVHIEEGLPLCVADAVDVSDRYLGFFEGLGDEFCSPFSVMLCGVAWEKPFSWGSDVSVPDVCEDYCWSCGFAWMLYYPYADFIGAAFYS